MMEEMRSCVSAYSGDRKQSDLLLELVWGPRVGGGTSEARVSDSDTERVPQRGLYMRTPWHKTTSPDDGGRCS